jgi:hypothetical protein
MANLSQVRPTKVLTLNDLADIEEKYGSLDQIDLTKFTVIRYILWLVLKKDEPQLTEREVGDRFSLDTMREEIDKVMRARGLLGGEAEGAAGKSEEAAKA